MFDSGVRFAKVVRVYPGGRSVDLVMYDDNSPCSNVQVMAGVASNRSGSFGLIAPTAPPDGEWGNQDSGDEDMTAVVAFNRGEPLVIGFWLPQVNQTSFVEKNLMGYRFPSDVYVTCNDAGDFELSFPGGAFIRVAADPAHVRLTGKDVDGKWNRDRNTGQRVHIHIEQAGGKASLNIDPEGNIDIKHVGNLNLETGGSLTATIGGTADVTAGGAATVTAPSVTLDTPDTTCTGNLLVKGALTYKGGMTGSGGNAAAVLSGDVQVVGNISASGTITDAGGNTNHHSH